MRAARALLAGALALAAAGAARAAPGDCLGFADVSAGAALAIGQVTARPRVHFLRNASANPACPAAGEACAERAYLVAGDTVILGGAAAPGLVCASFVNPRGLVRAGWLPAGAVAVQPAGPAGRAEDWFGTWQGGPESRITIRSGTRPGMLRIEGSATFGATDPERVRRGAVNMGEIGAELPASGPALGFAMAERGTLRHEEAGEFDCAVRLRLLGPFLLAEDNGRCGGVNVSFSGAYRRAAK